jgi:hypothetical protein
MAIQHLVLYWADRNNIQQERLIFKIIVLNGGTVADAARALKVSKRCAYFKAKRAGYRFANGNFSLDNAYDGLAA